MFLVVDLVPGRLFCKFHRGYHGDVVLVLLLYFVLDLGRSQVIALRRSYYDDCSCSCFYYCVTIRMLFLSVIFPCCCSCSE
jgi:hypothetical protein